MNARRRLRITAMSALAAGALVATAWVDGPPAGAVRALEVGSWWTAQPAGGGLPAPPDVGPGDLWIAGQPTGPSAVSAVRFQLADTESAPILTLHVDRSTAPAGATILACPTAGPWRPAHAGPWAERPRYDCGAGSVEGTFALDGSLVSFDLSPLVHPPVVSVALVPTPAASPPVAPPVAVPPVGATFDVTLRAPSLRDLDVHTEVAAGPGETAPAPGADTPPDAFAMPLAMPAAAPTVGTPVTGATRAAVPGLRVPPPSRAPLRLGGHPHASGRAGTGDRDVRLVAAVVLAALAATWYRLARGDDPAGRRPRLSLHDDPALLPAPPAPHLRGAPALR